MPMPVITQPMMIAPGDAPRDMSLGRLKTPPPIIEPTTRAISGTSVSLCVVGRTSPTVTSAAAVAMTPAPVGINFAVRVVDLGRITQPARSEFPIARIGAHCASLLASLASRPFATPGTGSAQRPGNQHVLRKAVRRNADAGDRVRVESVSSPTSRCERLDPVRARPTSVVREARHSSGSLGRDRVGFRHALADESCRHDRGHRIEQVEKGER